jgi:PAS domain S-box-containing protein
MPNDGDETKSVETGGATDFAMRVLESISDGFFTLDADWNLTYVNDLGARLLRGERQKLVGRNHWNLFPELAGTIAEREFRRVAREKEPSEFEIFYVPWQQWFYVKAYPLQTGGISVYFHDITANKEDKLRLEKQWRMFDTVVSNVADLLFVYDLEGRFTYVNRAVTDRSRRSLEQTVGKNMLELGYPPELVERLNGQIRKVAETKQPIRDQTQFHSGDGQTRDYEYIYMPVLAADGSVEAIAGSSRDITERKLAEARELERQAQARESARLESLGVMAGGIAHDFNNILTGILGNASLLVETGQGGELAEEIVASAERAAILTKQMLAYSGKGRFAVETVDLNRLIHQDLVLLRATIPRSVAVELHLAGEPCPVDVDPAQIHQVIMNLMINASEATCGSAGKIAIRSAIQERAETPHSEYLHQSVPAGTYVLLEIRDDGVGMSANTLKKIFDPFFTTKFTGRGLGLAAVLGIVRGHCGDIEVDSSPGAGTVFRIFLPLSTAPLPPQEEPVPEPVLEQAHRTVLVVDDEEIVRNVAKCALERAGFRVLTAADGKQALEALRREPQVALVILDLSMPVMTGDEALPEIRKRHPRIPVILSTGFSEAEIYSRFSGAGIAGVLQKPYTISTIVSKVIAGMGDSGLDRDTF